MRFTAILALIIACKYVNAAVVIKPDTSDPFITATLTSDPRGINSIDNSNNEWKLFQDYDNPLTDWYTYDIYNISYIC